MEPGTDDDAPGWDALEEHVRRSVAVPGGDSLHWGSGGLPGQEGIDGVSAYAAPGVWLYLTFGLSELYAKVSDDPAVSGWGFELTMRVPRRDDQPPTWPVQLLAQLGGHVFSTGQPFAAGHRVGGTGLSTDNPDSRLAGVVLADDPELAPVGTVHGRVEFLQVVGATADELERMRASTSAEVLAELRAADPLLVTDPWR